MASGMRFATPRYRLEHSRYTSSQGFHGIDIERFAVTIYEAKSIAGGMLYWGIPQYRLPKEILDYEIELIRRRGVKINLNCAVGKDIDFEKLDKEYDAIYISTGAHVSRKLGIKGESKKGVLYGVEFLKQVGEPEEKPVLNGRVTVIGGGNVAVDVARLVCGRGAGRERLFE